MKWILAVALMAMAGMACATRQVAEVVVVNGEPTALLAEPLAPLLERPGIAANFRAQIGGGCATDNWRGYQGTWEIRDNALYLVKLTSCHVPDGVPIDAVIPGATTPLKAIWFSGNLTIPLTKRRMAWHLGEDFLLEHYELIAIVDGVVKERKTIERTKYRDASGAKASAPAHAQ